LRSRGRRDVLGTLRTDTLCQALYVLACEVAYRQLDHELVQLPKLQPYFEAASSNPAAPQVVAGGVVRLTETPHRLQMVAGSPSLRSCAERDSG